ncbi:MFS transporter, partial [Exiguobacterium himgiriensis]
FAISLSAVSAVCRSGTEHALLYETLESGGKDGMFERWVGRLNGIGLVAAVVAAFSGSLLAARFSFELNYVVSIGSLFFATSCSLLLVEPIRSTHDEAMTWRQLRSGFRFLWNDRALLTLTVSFVLIIGAFNFVEEFWQLYARDVRVPIYWFGVISTGLLLIQIPGQLLAPYLLRVASAERWHHGIGWGIGIGFLLIGSFPSPFGFVWMALMACFAGAIEPIYYGVLHHRVPSAIRATTESSVSVLLHGSIVGLGFLFVVGAECSLFGAFLMIGVVVCLSHAKKRTK